MALQRVVFVCTANIARSPYAERRMRQLLAAAGVSHVVVSSAGIPGFEGRPMDSTMEAQLARRGADGADHSSRVLSEPIMAEADVVLVMEFAQQLKVWQAWPQLRSRGFGLMQFAAAAEKVELRGESGAGGSLAAIAALTTPNSMTLDVADPHKRGNRAAKRCATQIDAALESIVATLV